MSSFLEEVNRRSGEEVQLCFQCFKCTLGCPVAFAMDYSPHQIMRLIQMGFREKVLNSHSIWICAACETCTTRCPNGIDIARVIDTLRQISLEENKVAEKDIVVFHKSFLETIRRHGRLYEPELMMWYKIRTKHFFDDMQLASEMFKRKKISFKINRVKDLEEIKKIFRRANLWRG